MDLNIQMKVGLADLLFKPSSSHDLLAQMGEKFSHILVNFTLDVQGGEGVLLNHCLH